MCRHLSKCSKQFPSTNDFVDGSKFPTHFSSVSEVANIVSTYHIPGHIVPL
jgi:hypothetical protein